MKMCVGFFLLLALSAATVARAEGDGIGGILLRDVTIETDEDEWPTVLPAGGLLAFGFGSDWSATNRKNGKINSEFLIREEDGDRDGGNAWIPEDAVKIFSWSCGEPQKKIGSKGFVVCSPFVTTGVFASSSQWNLRFVAEARTAAREAGLQVVEEFSPAYKGGAQPAAVPGSTAPEGSKPSTCSVEQILKMKDAGLSEEQIKAACGG